MTVTRKINKFIKHVRQKTKKKTYDNKPVIGKTHIIIKCYFPGEDDLQYQYLEQILKKYNMFSNQYINNVIKEDYKLLKIQRIKKCNDITKLKYINNKILNLSNLSLIFFNITYINLNTRYYGIKTLLSNVLTRDKINSIENKSNLYYSFHNYNKTLANKYLPLTFNINEFDKYKFGDEKENTNTNYYILKPVDSMGGVDIIYISSMKEVQNAIEYYKTHKNYRNRIYGNNVISQEYITKPLLYYKANREHIIGYGDSDRNRNKNRDIDRNRDLVGYKCHFRVPFVVSYINKKIDSFILEDGIRILTAKEPYNMDLPFQKELHDTHIKSSGGDYFLKSDSEDYKNLQITLHQRDKIINEFRKISKILENILKKDSNEFLYPEHKNGFHIFGIDFMIEDNKGLNNKTMDNDELNVKLIEVNNSPSFIFHNKSNTHTQSKLLFQELDKHIFSKIF